MKKTNDNKYKILVVLIAFSVGICISLCQFQATAYAIDLKTELNLTDTQYAVVASVPMLAGTLLSFIAGTLGDKLGVKKALFIALVISGTGAILRAFSPSYILLLLTSFLIGVALVMYNANSTKLVNAWISEKNRGTVLGAILTAANAGILLAMAIGRNLSPNYRVAFVYGGLTLFIIAVIWILLIKEKEEVKGISYRERVSIRPILKNKYIWLAALCYAFFLGISMAATALLSPGLIERGVPEIEANTAVIIYTALVIVSSMIGPKILKKIKNKRKFCFILGCLMGLPLFIAWKTNVPLVRYIMMIISALATGPIPPVIMSTPILIKEIDEKEYGMAGGVITTAMMAGGFFIPSYLLVPIANGVNDITFMLVGICALVVGVSAALLPQETNGEKNEKV